MNAKEAQNLRMDAAQVRENISELEAQHKTASRGEKITITKKLNEAKETLRVLDAKLYDAPPAPMNPSDIWEALTYTLNYEDAYQKDLAEFNEKITTQGIGHTVSWYGVGIIKSEKRAQLTRWFKRLEEEENLEVRLDKFFKVMVTEFKTQLLDSILRGARKQTSQSTSQMSNMVEAAQLEVTAELYEEFFGDFGYKLNRIEAKYNSWKEIQEVD